MDSDPARARRESRRREREVRRRRIRRRRASALLIVLAVLAAVGIGASRLGGGPHGGVGESVSLAGTSQAGAVESARIPAAPKDAKISVAAVGDIVMGSQPWGLPPDGGASFFDPVDRLLEGDVVLGNLEGTLATGGRSKCGPTPSPNCFAFQTPPSYARRLREAGFTVMTVANNHSYDFGATGQRQTLASLRRVGLRSTGLPGSYVVLEPNGLRVAVLGFAPYRWANDIRDIPGAVRLVRKASRQAHIVIVTMHAGAEGTGATRVRPGTETFLGEDRGDVVRFSHAVVDAGADLVVGHGPHVLRGMEMRKGRLIAYSMGNFAGYRVFALGGASSTSGVLQAELGADGRLLSARLAPTKLVPPGTPAPGGSGIATVRRLSRLDFGRRAPIITAKGVIKPRTS